MLSEKKKSSRLCFLAVGQELLYLGRSVLLWFRDGLRELLGDCNEKGAFVTNNPGNVYRRVRQGEEQTKFKGQTGPGTGLSRPPRRGSPKVRKSPAECRNGRGFAAPLPDLESPCPERFILIIKSIHASLGELFILPRQQAPAALRRGMLEVGLRAGAALSPRPGRRGRVSAPGVTGRERAPFRSTSPPPQRVLVSSPSPPPRAVPALPCS